VLISPENDIIAGQGPRARGAAPFPGVDANRSAAASARLRRSRYSGTSKRAVCRTFGLKHTTLIDLLAWIGWSAGLRDTGRHK
jgi:hypothetical protein